MVKNRALLVSMPGVHHQYPSLQVGCLVSYARRKGYNIEGKHLHLQIAALFGIKKYIALISANYSLIELFFASYFFSCDNKRIIKYLHNNIPNSDDNLKKLFRVVKKCYENIDWKRYGIVGFTIGPNQLFASLLFAKWLRRDFPNIRVVFGGSRVGGGLGANILKCFIQVDWCVDGEGEIALTSLLHCLRRNVQDVEKYVPGLIYRNNRGVSINPRHQLKYLRNLPDPDFDDYFRLLDQEHILKKKEIIVFIPIESSRGCPHHCAFCTIHACWDGYRTRPAIEVSSQIRRLSERYRINRFQFVDSCVPVSEQYNLFSLLERDNLDYNIFYEIRADIKKTQLELMKRAGVRWVQIGIEALSTSLLNKMRKGTTVLHNLQTMKFCEELGIIHDSNLIIAFPTESQSDVNESVRNIWYALPYRPPARLVKFELYQGAPAYNQEKKYKISKIRNPKLYTALLPRNLMNSLSISPKEYRSNQMPRSYNVLRKMLNRWNSEYHRSIINNRKLLVYYDMGDVLHIEDSRPRVKGVRLQDDYFATITLCDEFRELYLFCDSIRSIKDIEKQFANIGVIKIRNILNELLKLGIMVEEDKRYLSLAMKS